MSKTVKVKNVEREETKIMKEINRNEAKRTKNLVKLYEREATKIMRRMNR